MKSRSAVKHRHNDHASGAGNPVGLKPLKSNHRVNKHHKNSSTKHNSAVNRKKRKKKKSPEHPLAVEFRGTLENSTSSITTQLVSELTNAHQIRLSRIAAATSTSQELLNAAGQITEKLQSALILSPKFEDNLTGLHAFVAEKQTRINELFKEHQQLTEEMKQLQEEVMDINPMNYVKKHHMDVGDDDDVNDDEFMEDVVASVRGVGRKWVGRMEESERKFQLDAHKQSQLAAAAML